MNYEFLTQFLPHIYKVMNKDEEYWKRNDYTTSLKTHPNVCTFGYVYKGKALFELGDISTSLQAGSIFQVTSDSKLYLKTTPKDCVHIYSIHYFSSLVKWEGITRKAVTSTSALPFPIVYHSTKDPKLRELFNEMYEIWRKKEPDYQWKAKISMFSIMDLVDTLLKNDNEQIHDQTHLVPHAIEYMKNHYQSPINRDMLAQYVSLSPNYFSTLFKNQTGYTPMQYLTKLRMDKAKQLLHTTNLPIAKIGRCVGFTDNFYFSRVFTKETGLCPKKYKGE